MFREKFAQLTSDFASQILAAIANASLEELKGSSLPSRAGGPSAARAAVASETTGAVAKRKPGRPRKEPTTTGAGETVSKKAAAPAAPARPLTESETAAATVFFKERQRKGATASQLLAHFEEQGIEAPATIVEELTTRGVIRDAGFRRAAGNGNATAPVFVFVDSAS